ncbi:MAG: glycosidase, partial [Planctomycetota bacterium]|nr:glycosidase [Planctomycetota bacterium]
MKTKSFTARLAKLKRSHDQLLRRKNRVNLAWYNGIYERYVHPVITAEHVPLEWRFDLNPKTNPHLLERLGVNATFNAGAIFWQGKYLLCLLYTS